MPSFCAKSVGGLAASEGKLRHLGVPTAPSRSTLAYANEHRPWQLYEAVFDQLLGKCQAVALSRRDHTRKFRFKNKLLSRDATVIDLCASVFDWARFRQTKGAVKLHLLLDHDGYLREYAVITEGKRHEVRVARSAGPLSELEAGSARRALMACARPDRPHFSQGAARALQDHPGGGKSSLRPRRPTASGIQPTAHVYQPAVDGGRRHLSNH
ncbi:MAG: hypothetical protein ABSF15_18300 [Candidatus Sulfotelmatobacter sp.]|jgi:hypothetical protein